MPPVGVWVYHSAWVILSVNYCHFYSRKIREEKKIKSSTLKRKVQQNYLSLLANDMILLIIRRVKSFTKNSVSKLENTYTTYKNQLHFCTLTIKHLKTQKSIPFTKLLRKSKCPGFLTQEVKICQG